MRRLLILLLAFALFGCGKDHARSVLNAYMTAVEKQDIPTFVHLTDPNIRAYIEKGSLRKEDTLGYIDTITAQPVRVLRSPTATLYIGWVRVEQPTARDYGFAVATHSGWWVIAGLGALILVVGLLTTGDWARATAVRTAERFREPVVSRA